MIYKSKGLPDGKNVYLRQELKKFVVYCTLDDEIVWWAETNSKAMAEFIYNFED